MPESEVYRFWNGGLLTSTERVTVPVVFADHPLLLSNSVVESPVLSLLIGRDVVGGLGLDIKGSNRTLEYNGRSQPLEDSVAGHYCMTLSPERYARLLKLESSPDPPTSRLRPRPTSLVPRNSRSKLASTLEICLSLQQQHLWTAQVCDKRVVLQTARDTSWHVTDWASGSTVPSHAKKDFHQLRAGVDRARIVAHHCIHPSRVRSGLRMTRTAPVDPLSHSVCSFWVVCHFLVAGLSHEISACREKCRAVDQSGCEHSRPQETHFPDHCQCFDAKTVTATRVSTPTISEFSWIQRGVDLRCQQSPVAVETSSRNFGISTIASAQNHDSDREVFSGRAVITSTTTASTSARGSPECDDCQKTADFLSCKLCLKSCDRLSCATEAAGNPCVCHRETFSGSRRAPQCQCSCGSCGYQI